MKISCPTVWEASQGTLTIETPRMAVEKDGNVNGHLPQRRHICALFFSEERWKHSLHCEYYSSSIYRWANYLMRLDFNGFNFRGVV